MSGIGAEDLEREHQAPPDYERGAGGEPLITMPDGKRERYARTSSLGDTLDEKSGLANWKTTKAMEGLAHDDALIARVKAATPYEENRSEWPRLREDAINAGRGSWKADIGTAVHKMSERWEADETYDPGAPYTAPLEAYSVGLAELGLVSQMMEVQIVNDDLRIAGTVDRVYELTKPLIAPDDTVLRPGELVIGDLKTGSSLEYSIPGYAVQLAGYASGQLYDVVTNTRQPTPQINQRWAIIVHISVEEATCEFLWVDLEVGHFGARLANEVKEWRRNWRRKDGYKSTLLPVAVGDDVPAEEPTDDLEAWRNHHRIRLDAIRANAEAKEWMLIRWPEDLLPPKKLETLEQSAALDDFLARVEAEFGLPFAEGRPVATGRKAE